jgi:hypothetical protein
VFPLNPDSIRSGSGSRRVKTKNYQQKKKKLRNFMFEVEGAEGFSCSLDVLYAGLGKSKLQFLVKIITFFSGVNFWSSKPLDPDWIRNRFRIGI